MKTFVNQFWAWREGKWVFCRTTRSFAPSIEDIRLTLERTPWPPEKEKTLEQAIAASIPVLIISREQQQVLPFPVRGQN